MPIGQSNQPASNDDATSLVRVSGWPWSTTLRQTISAIETIIPVETTAGASSPNGIAHIRGERIVYTGMTGNTLTGCLRGQFPADGGGAASEHPGGEEVIQKHSSTMHRVLVDSLIAAQTRISTLEGAIGGGSLVKRYVMGAPAAGDTVTSPTNVATDYASAYTVPAGDMVPGRLYKIWAAGLYTTTASSPNVSWRLRFGTMQLVLDTVTFGTIARNNRPWRFEFTVNVITAGTTGTVEVTGSGRLFTTANTEFEFEFFNTAPITVDTTIAQRLGLSVNSNSAGTTTQQREFLVLAA